MPLKGWAAFNDAHHKPFVIVAALVTKGKGQSPFDLLQRLLRSLPLTGNFAMSRGEDFIRVAFEAEADARVVVKVLSARPVAQSREEWAGHWEFGLDVPAMTTIRAMVAGKRAPRQVRSTTPRVIP
jgi:hypothetical protein